MVARRRSVRRSSRRRVGRPRQACSSKRKASCKPAKHCRWAKRASRCKSRNSKKRVSRKSRSRRRSSRRRSGRKSRRQRGGFTLTPSAAEAADRADRRSAWSKRMDYNRKKGGSVLQFYKPYPELAGYDPKEHDHPYSAGGRKGKQYAKHMGVDTAKPASRWPFGKAAAPPPFALMDAWRKRRSSAGWKKGDLKGSWAAGMKGKKCVDIKGDGLCREREDCKWSSGGLFSSGKCGDKPAATVGPQTRGRATGKNCAMYRSKSQCGNTTGCDWDARLSQCKKVGDVLQGPARQAGGKRRTRRRSGRKSRRRSGRKSLRRTRYSRKRASRKRVSRRRSGRKSRRRTRRRSGRKSRRRSGRKSRRRTRRRSRK